MSEEEVKTIITRMLSKLSSSEKRLLFAIDEEKNKEIKNLHSIIKEAREYIENAIKIGNCSEDISYENGIEKEHNYYVNSKDILEILDKVEENK